MEIVLVFAVFILIAVVFRLAAGGLDTGRIEEYVRGQGWELIDRSWDPFGPGWFGEKDARIYQVVYRDERGDTHKAHVKTSMFSGVYLTHDSIVSRAERDSAPVTEVDRLEDENRRLRERLEELEQRRD